MPQLFMRTLLMVPLLALAVWHSTLAAAPLQVVTEELPPYNMTANGQVTGMSTEVVQAVLARLGLQVPIQVMPWARAYDVAQHQSDVLIYSIARTPQREKLFQWVGSIAPSRWYLYSASSRPIELNDLNDAKRYQVATVNQDAGEQYLVAHGFALGQALQSSTRYELDYQKLKRGHVDLWISNELNANYIVRELGDDPAKEITPALALPELGGKDGLYMAFSPQTSAEWVERFRKALRQVREDGTYDAIARKWL
ncbi:transporter substrate-binding domain-containing protein [Pseudomonas typographi]|uniref:Amino acid ABC transporter substrate-binding protein n=1 Tax=Pseudomonas typographi TaxID=2715964 RepID=A0ABR7Z5G2_9PSED|nr:amino acid ABC transporter substrate-binding protein [Pseudomonas typographi]MBD1600687.1 amino acid ABC transporter substrate-binding protein [Pseudomonas typographi]